MNKVMTLTYASSLSDLREINSSFDSGILQIAYPGLNRNKSYISKETFERCIKTMYNCPIVCNYNIETDTLGGHDMDVVTDSEGDLRLINLTDPVGVIPESAEWWWGDPVIEDDGAEREYLYTECLIWKRQPAYKKIAADGDIAHSMEITVKEGHLDDGVFYIEDFEFTAFALIGAEPCFESSALHMFSGHNFKMQLSKMMQELEETFTKVDTSSEVDNIHPQDNSTKGGLKVLEDKMELVAKYGVDVESLDFSIDDLSIEELTEKFEAMTADSSEDDSVETVEEQEEQHDQENFELNGNISQELYRMMSEKQIDTEWGTYPEYCVVDFDISKSEIYAWDSNDWLLYGFSFEMNGDAVVINWESKKRVKYIIADFDEGEQASPFAQAFTLMKEKLQDYSELSAKYQTASDTIESMNHELDELKEYKAKAENAIAESKRCEVLSSFADLEGIEAFEEVKEHAAEYELNELEEKCFAIRGRNGAVVKYSFNENRPKIVVDRSLRSSSKDPYGGVFAEYGFDAEN